MDDELEPLGLPTPAQAGNSLTLSELIAEHPLVAVAASAAVGAGVMALIAASTRPHATPAHGHRIGNDVSEKVSQLQAQLGELFSRLTESLPSKGEVNRAAGNLGDQASKAFNGALNGARHSLHGVSSAGVNVTQTALAHPLLTSLVLGAVGTVLASLTSSSAGDTKSSPGVEKANGAGQAEDASP